MAPAIIHETVILFRGVICYNDPMNERNIVEEVMKPNPMKSFFSGLMSGLFTGAVMMGIYALVAATGLVGGMAIPNIIGMIAVTGLFTGTMAAMRGDKDAKATALVPATATVPVIAETMGRAPQIAMDATDDMAAPSRRDGKSWTDSAGRSASSQSRIQQIVSDGSMGDKDRASAILAARDAASSEATRA